MAFALSSSRRRQRPRVEQLEPRLLLSGFQPTGLDQLFLEELNDARANPTAYGQSIGVDLSAIAPSQPLAFSPQLVEAARLHSQDMNDRAYFAHDTPEGVTPDRREAAAGFPGSFAGESLAAGSTLADPAAALALLITDPGLNPPGHRNHLLSVDDPAQSAVGIGGWSGRGPYTNYWTIDTGTPADTRPYLCGVVFHDDNGNGKYDPGEGFANVAVTVQRQGTALSFASGGYSIQVDPGTYTVTASGGGLAAPVTQTVTVGSSNVRLNFLAQAEGSWAQAAPLPAGQAALAVVAGQDGRLYAIGGTDTNNQPVGTLQAYTPASNSWAPLASMPTPRDSLAAAWGTDGRLYVFGGQDASGTPLSVVEVYDPTTNTWAERAAMPVARTAAAAVTEPDGRIYLIGGASGRGTFVTGVDVYDPATDSWSTAAALPTARTGLAAVLGPDGRIYALGGADADGRRLGTVEVYDPATNTWSGAADMPDPHAFFAAVPGPDARLYALGGDGALFDTGAAVQVYTPASNTWGTLADLPVPRSNLGAAVGSDGRIYAVGGYSGSASAAVDALSVPVELAFAAAAFPVAEGAASATITVIRTGSSAGAVSVHYAATPGTAVAGIDFTPVSGTLSFADGQTFRQFTVPLFDDAGRGERDETINLALSSPSAGVTLSASPSAVLIVQENDPPSGPGAGAGPRPGAGAEQGHGPAPYAVILIAQRFGKKMRLVAEVFFVGGLPPLNVFSPYQKPAYSAIAVAAQGFNADGTFNLLLFTARKGKRHVSSIVPV